MNAERGVSRIECPKIGGHIPHSTLDTRPAFRLSRRMSPTHRNFASGLAFLSFWTLAAAEPASLTKEELAAAVRTDDFSIPTPGELMVAMDKFAKLAWKTKYRVPIPTNFTSRPQMALNLGTLIADGYIAIQAQDEQAVKDVGKDIMALAKPLGVRAEIIDRGKKLADFAEQKNWDPLKEELEATQNEAKAKLAENQDKDLVALVTIGGWARGTQVISSHIIDHYSPEAAKLLRQPGIVTFLSEKLEALPAKLRDDPAVKYTRTKLAELRTAVSFSADTAPTAADVQRINAIAADLIREISRKDIK